METSALALPADIKMRARTVGQIDVEKCFALAFRPQRWDNQRQGFYRDGRGWLDERDFRPWWNGGVLRPGRVVAGPEWQRRQHW
jgi:hypothetical protein